MNENESTPAGAKDEERPGGEIPPIPVQTPGAATVDGRTAAEAETAAHQPATGSRAETGELVAPLAVGSEAPDSLHALLEPQVEPGGPAPAAAPRVSTILGPLPTTVSARRTRSLNDAVHEILVIGLAVSTVLLVSGLVLGLIEGRALPTQTLPLSEAFSRALALRPSGLVALGLLTLMLTPIVRVVGSVIVFIWERDRRYTLVTLFVLAVMIVSLVVGEG